MAPSAHHGLPPPPTAEGQEQVPLSCHIPACSQRPRGVTAASGQRADPTVITGTQPAAVPQSKDMAPSDWDPPGIWQRKGSAAPSSGTEGMHFNGWAGLLITVRWV